MHSCLLETPWYLADRQHYCDGQLGSDALLKSCLLLLNLLYISLLSNLIILVLLRQVNVKYMQSIFTFSNTLIWTYSIVVLWCAYSSLVTCYSQFSYVHILLIMVFSLLFSELHTLSLSFYFFLIFNSIIFILSFFLLPMDPHDHCICQGQALNISLSILMNNNSQSQVTSESGTNPATHPVMSHA